MKAAHLPDWQRRRSELNHQWLKNRLLSALDSADNLMQGRIRGSGYLEDIVQGEVREWGLRQMELQELICSFQAEMSPRRLFDGSPFCDWPQDEREIVGELMHCLWVTQYSMDELVSNAQAALTDASEAYDRVLGAEHMWEGGEVERTFRRNLEAFRSACHALAKAVERFPSSVMVL